MIQNLLIIIFFIFLLFNNCELTPYRLVRCITGLTNIFYKCEINHFCDPDYCIVVELSGNYDVLE